LFSFSRMRAGLSPLLFELHFVFNMIFFFPFPFCPSAGKAPTFPSPFPSPCFSEHSPISFRSIILSKSVFSLLAPRSSPPPYLQIMGGWPSFAKMALLLFFLSRSRLNLSIYDSRCELKALPSPVIALFPSSRHPPSPSNFLRGSPKSF